MIEKSSMVTRIISDQETAVAFYTDIVGFEIKMEHLGPHGRFLTVAPGTDEHVQLILMTPDGFDAGRQTLEET